MKFFAVLALAAAVQAIPVSECKENASKAEVQCMRDCNWSWWCSTKCALGKTDDYIKCELDEQTTSNTIVKARDQACTERVAREEAACINGCNGAGLCTARCSISRVQEYINCARN